MTTTGSETLSLDTLSAALRASWSAATSCDPHWTPACPAAGQCAVSALVLQDHAGGTLMRCEAAGQSHYFLRLDGGTDVDLTREQFAPGVTFTTAEPADRERVLAHPGTRERYQILAAAVAAALAPGAEIPWERIVASLVRQSGRQACVYDTDIACETGTLGIRRAAGPDRWLLSVRDASPADGEEAAMTEKPLSASLPSGEAVVAEVAQAIGAYRQSLDDRGLAGLATDESLARVAVLAAAPLIGADERARLYAELGNEHYVIFTGDGWTTEHSVECRLSGRMSECGWHEAVRHAADAMVPDLLGRWRITGISEGLPDLERADG